MTSRRKHKPGIGDLKVHPVRYTPEGLELWIPLAQALVSAADADQDARTNIGIGICNGGDVAATDGHVMLLLAGCDPGTGDWPPTRNGLRWSVDHVMFRIRAAKAANATMAERAGPWDATVLLRYADATPGFARCEIPLQGSPAGFEEAAPTAFNAELIARFVPLQKALGPRAYLQLVRVGTPSSPLRFYMDTPEWSWGRVKAEVLVMPINL